MIVLIFFWIYNVPNFLKMVEFSKNSFKHFTTGVSNKLKNNQIKFQICLLKDKQSSVGPAGRISGNNNLKTFT